MKKQLIYKLAVLDLDGSLLNDQMKLSSVTKSDLNKIINMGLNCVISSSRMLSNILSYINNIKFLYISALNGSLIYNNILKCIEYIDVIPSNIVMDISNLANNKDINLILFTIDKAYILSYSNNPIDRKYQKSLKPITINDKYYPEKILSIEIIVNNSLVKKDILHELKYNYMNFIEIKESGNNYIEINKKGINKGKSLEYIANKLSIPLKQTIAVGDNEVDLPMLEKAGIGIGMKNSSNVVLSTVKYVTKKDNNNNGAMDFIINEVLKLNDTSKLC